MQERVVWCESEGVSILCCPEAILGGLADYCENPAPFAIRTDDNQLNKVLAPLASKTVTSIIGFTELAGDRLYNAAAVFHLGRVAGLYRKLHPAIRRSVYSAGTQTPVFRVGGLTLGIVICNDSTFSEPAKAMAGQGATVLFIPTNNTLPAKRAYQGLLQEARASDFARVAENRFWVIRADVAGANGGLVLVANVGKRAEIMKRVGVHTFRHSFTTRLLNHGADVRYIRTLLDHRSLNWTQRYQTQTTASAYQSVRG
jgi:predicted amidohydrolase